MVAASLLAGYALENLLKAVRVEQLRDAGASIVVKGKLRKELTGITLSTWQLEMVLDGQVPWSYDDSTP